MDVYRTPDEQFEGLPGYSFEPRYLEQDGLRMHYLDEGDGEPVLLLHGEPTWAFLYRKLIPRLSGVTRVVAPDYFGFGRSDKPTRIEDYSYDFHCRSIERFVDELDLRETTLVMQDWGGPIGLRLAVERPDRVARLVILNTGIGAGRAPSPEWLRFRELVRRVGNGASAGPARPDLVRERARRRGRRRLQRAVPDARVEGGRARIPRARSDGAGPPLRREDARGARRYLTLGASGARPLLRLRPDLLPAAAKRMAARIPGAGPAEIVSGAGHFLQEEKGEEIAERIVRFLAETQP